MWRSKKLIVGVVLAAVLLAGSIGGIALAADNGDDSQPGSRFETLLDKVCAIYEQNTGVAIEPEALKAAFAQAQDEMREAALDNYLQGLVDEGKITPEQKTQYKEWLESKPDMPFKFGFGGRGGFPGMGGFRGFGGYRGFSGPCAPAQ